MSSAAARRRRHRPGDEAGRSADAPDPPPADGAEALEVRHQRVLTDDGVGVGLHRLGPPEGPGVLLVPGTFSNHTFWLGTRGTGFARALAEAGFEACALDPRGHGSSDREPQGRRWTFEDWARRDVPAALGAAGAGRRPLWAVGHSAGGAALLVALAADPALCRQVSGIVIIGTPLPWLQGFRWAATRAVRWASRALGRFPARRLGLGPEDELAGVMIQWMTWNIEGHWRGAQGLDYEALLGELRLPALFLAGGGDHVEAPPAAVRALYERVGSPDKTFLLCARATGFSEDVDHPGLVVSRAARTEIWPRILSWLKEREPGLG